MNEFDESWIIPRAKSQADCTHVAGGGSCLGNKYSRTSIVWHTLRTKETVGICFNCNRKFRETDFDYWLWRKKRSLSYGSSDSSDNPANKGISYTPFAGPYEETDLDKLSDSEIKFLFDGARKYRRMLKVIEKEFSSPEWSVG